MALVQLVRTWAQRKQCTPAQLSLAWLLAQRPFIAPIPGTTQMPHLLDNIGGAVHFDDDELVALRTGLEAIPIHGARLPAAVQVYSDVEAPPKI